MVVAVRVAMQAAEERVRAVELVHDGAGIGTPRQQSGELRVELVHHRRAQAELPQVEVPRVPHLRLEVAGEQVVAAAGIDLARLRHRGHADGPALRCREGEARLLGREGTPQAFEVAPDLVLGEAQLVGPDELRIAQLMKRLASDEVREVVLATNPNVEGETTATYLARLIKPLGIAVTRPASGLPVGGDLEFADEVTLGRAIEARRPL